jgi:hypothetical protein
MSQKKLKNKKKSVPLAPATGIKMLEHSSTRSLKGQRPKPSRPVPHPPAAMEFGFRAGNRTQRRPSPDRRFTAQQGKRPPSHRDPKTCSIYLKVPGPAQPDPSTATTRSPRRCSGRMRPGASGSNARWSAGSSRRRSAWSSPLSAPASTVVLAPPRSSGPTAPSCRLHLQAGSPGPTAHR